MSVAPFFFTCDHAAAGDCREERGRTICNVCAAPVQRSSACPVEHTPAARKSLVGAIRIVREQMVTLRLGAIEIGENDAANRIFRMSQELSAIAGRVSA